MSSLDKIIVESLMQDLQHAKDTEHRKQIIAEINEIRQKDMIKKCIIFGIAFIIVLGAINSAYEKVKNVDTEVSKTASWYQE